MYFTNIFKVELLARLILLKKISLAKLISTRREGVIKYGTEEGRMDLTKLASVPSEPEKRFPL